MTHGLADTGATKEPNLAALQVRLEQVDDLNPGFEHLQLGRLFFEVRSWRWMDQCSFATTGRSGKSTGSPSTFNTRPSVPGPTGI